MVRRRRTAVSDLLGVGVLENKQLYFKPSAVFSYHVRGEDQYSFVFAAGPLGVAEQVGVIIHHILHTWTTIHIDSEIMSKEQN